MLIISLFLAIGWHFFTDHKGDRQDVAIIFNENDSLSVRVADYYQQRRGISKNNLIAIKLNPRQTELSPQEFQQIRATVTAKTPDQVQFYALIGSSPYQVGCMSITSAFAFGYDAAYCADGCQFTKPSPYFNSASPKPFTDFGIRPTMLIPTVNFLQARALIERGIQADHSFPTGTAYLMDTSDTARNVRSAIYPQIKRWLGDRFRLEVIKADVLKGRDDVMFYFTGLARVNNLTTNKFRPGAIADHLTSFGGQLSNSSQMSSLEWLNAGATGSYGTVVEPCNFPKKFPNPALVMFYSLQGDRLIEAYWKSVEQPGQGLFIGEPLAVPFRPSN